MIHRFSLRSHTVAKRAAVDFVDSEKTVARSTIIARPRLIIDNLQLFFENDIASDSAAECAAGENIGWEVGLQGHA